MATRYVYAYIYIYKYVCRKRYIHGIYCIHDMHMCVYILYIYISIYREIEPEGEIRHVRQDADHVEPSS